ncbi:MAG: sensor histidine kinase [Phycicoccus sp.]
MDQLAGRDGLEVSPGVLTALGAAAQAVAVALVIAIGSRGGEPAGSGAYLFAVLFGAFLLLRTEYPGTMLVLAVLAVFVYYAADYPPIGMAVPVVGAFYAAAERGRVVLSLGVGVVLLGVSLYFRTRDGEPSTVLAYDVITNAALLGCAVALAVTVRSRRDVRRQHERMRVLERSHEEERATRRVEEERLRIARDVHDSMGHALSLVLVQARVAREAVGVDDPAAGRALDHVVTAAAGSLTDLRRTLGMLRGADDAPDLAPLTLSGIERVAESARAAGLRVDLDVATGDVDVPTPVAGAAFRIIQEAVTNVIRHADASSLTVRIHADDDELRVIVTDDGAAARTLDQLDGRGIEGIRERAALLGGHARAEPTTSGFVVDATLPVRAAS